VPAGLLGAMTMHCVAGLEESKWGVLVRKATLDRSMTNRNRLIWIICAVVAAATYISAALWLKFSYVEPTNPAGSLFRLSRPFFQVQGSKIAFVAKAPPLDHLSDTMEFPTRSPIMLYENALPLGPAHTEHTEILKYGLGRFSHWNNEGLIFSSSDGTNPQTNGRTYWAVIPPGPAN
jgi:hypothetical protein